MAVLRYIWSLKWSLAGGVAAFALSFLSLGLLGYLLYYLAYPVVTAAYAPLDRWRPDSVWPLIVGAGIVWSVSFVPAGAIDHALAVRGTSRSRRTLAYLVVLWIGAAAAWLFLLATNHPPLRP